MTKRRYVIVGTGHRSSMFFRATTDTYAATCDLVGLCDTNQTRMDYWNRELTEKGKTALPTFKADRFDEMIRQLKPDAVIVTTRDCDHDKYVVRAMELGVDVIVEKPMTTDEHKCKALLDTIRRTGRKCTVSFNARYGPPDTKVKELLAGGVIGKVHSVSYEHLLDVHHGADYFRRWHRAKVNSGGLMVHKCTHCFDLVNWWLDARPQTVAAYGDVRFYGPQHGAHGKRCRTCELTRSCKFFFDLSARKEYSGLYLAAEHEDGYFRDQCVFGDGITTEDNVAVIVTYDTGAALSYQLNAFSPYEGSRIVFNGQAGRLEMTEIADTSWLIEDVEGRTQKQDKAGGTRIEVFPHHAASYAVDWEAVSGGHGGADSQIVGDLFSGQPSPDPLGRRADHLDGARSILIGIAANRSMERGQPVRIDELVKLS